MNPICHLRYCRLPGDVPFDTASAPRFLLRLLLGSAAISSVFLIGAPSAFSADLTWNSTVTSGNWTTAANWSPSASITANDTLTFNGTAGSYTSENTLAAATQIGIGSGTAITFGNAVGANFTLTGNSITLGGDVVTIARTDSAGARSSTIQLDLILNGTRTFTVAGTGANATALSVSGNISESGGAQGLNKEGTGTLTLSGNNSFTGAVSVGNAATSGGVLSLGHNNALGTASAVTLTGTGSVLEIQNGITINRTLTISNTGNAKSLRGATNANAEYSGNITISETTVGNFDVNTNGGTLTLSGTISGTGAAGINKTSSGTLVLTGNNSFTGNLSIERGPVNISTLTDTGVNSNIGRGSTISIGSSTQVATLTFNGTAAASSNRTIRVGDNTSGATRTGGAVINNNSANATHTLTFTAATSDTAFNLQQTTANVTRTLTLGGTNTGNNTIQGKIQDNDTDAVVTLTKADAGKWVLSGNNTYTGSTTVSAGTLIGTNTQAFGMNASGITIAAAGTLSMRNDASVTFGNGTTAYNVANSASGATIDVDRLSGPGSNTLTMGNLTTISTSATWQENFTGANGTSLSAGILTTPTTASDAVHTINNNITGGGNLTLAGIASGGTGNSTLTFSGTGTTIVSGAITQAGSNQKLTSSVGRLVLNGANTYTGNTTISNGILVAANNSALGTTGNGTFVSAGATLALQGDITITSEEITLLGVGETVGLDTVGALSNVSGNNTIDGNANILVGSATQLTTEIHSTAGNLVISGTGVMQGNSAHAHTLALHGAGNGTISRVIQNGNATSLSLVKEEAGTWTLGGANSYSGNTTISAGTLALGADNVLPTGVGKGNVAVTGTLDLNGFNLERVMHFDERTYSA